MEGPVVERGEGGDTALDGIRKQNKALNEQAKHEAAVVGKKGVSDVARLGGARRLRRER
jgi:hypothetical protein